MPGPHCFCIGSGSLNVHINKLLPGPACEDYCYRFQSLGVLDRGFDSDQQVLSWWREFLARHPSSGTSDFHIRRDGVFLHKTTRGYTAWLGGSNIALSVVHAHTDHGKRSLLNEEKLQSLLTAMDQ